MKILGLNAYHADSSAALIVDGKMVAATEEERFERIKHWAGFPSNSIAFCLKEAGISLDEVDYITVGRDPSVKRWRKFVFLFKYPHGATTFLLQRLKNRGKIGSLAEEFETVDPQADLENLSSKLCYIEHHRSHLASAFYASPYEEAALLSIDGSGDFTTIMIGKGSGNEIQVLDSVDFPVSVGLFYTTFTQFLGFPHYGDEYKVMGLAPYGEPRYLEKVRRIINLESDGLISWDDSYFNFSNGISNYVNHVPGVAKIYSNKFAREYSQFRREKGDPLEQKHKDLAASVQKFTEEIIFHLAEDLHLKTGLKNLCLAGGVAQNSVANGKILTKTSFENIYIPSAGHDAGLSMGSALYQYHQIMGGKREGPVFSAFTGKGFDNEEIKQFLEGKELEYNYCPEEEIFDVVVNKLIEPGIVGWFSGRAEFGPRALGARSILADPRNSEARDLINRKIKFRESFRPFAPSILKEYTGEYFEHVEEVPFMEKVYPIKKEKQKEIPAVTHIDGTGRLQTVDSEITPRYYRLIDTFRNRTGVPLLLNTSFNENEPIVNTPEEALNCFLRTEMDMLVLENYVIIR